MGGEVARLVAEQSDMELAAAVEGRGHPGLGSSIAGIVVTTSEGDVGIDVMVDFTVPEASVETARRAAERSCALVVGTTGFSDAQLDELRALASDIPFVLAPNMSVGVNLLYGLVRDATAKLKGYDVEIFEMHHRDKRDAPSGTARRIAGIVEEVRGGASWRHGREGIVGARPKNEIGIHALRGGDVAGEHQVIYAGDGERIELVHRARSRRAFAAGTIEAIRFVVNRPAGLYDMRDVLGL
jgi:4-hydroxy-tetrahydrodipicolinate reductase